MLTLFLAFFWSDVLLFDDRQVHVVRSDDPEGPQLRIRIRFIIRCLDTVVCQTFLEVLRIVAGDREFLLLQGSIAR